MIHGRTNVNLTEIPDNFGQLVNYLMLYNEGDECTDVTGGWTAFKKNASVGTYESWSNGFRTENEIDTTSYSRIFAVALGYKVTNDYQGGIGIVGGNVAIAVTPTSKQMLMSGELSSVSGKAYCKVAESNVSDSNRTNTKNADNLYMRAYYTSSYDRRMTMYNMGLLGADDWKTLCAKAGVTVPADIDSLIADSSKLTTIFASESAITFMVKRCTGDFMVSVVANSTALGLLKASPHYTMVQANEHWAKFLAMVA